MKLATGVLVAAMGATLGVVGAVAYFTAKVDRLASKVDDAESYQRVTNGYLSSAVEDTKRRIEEQGRSAPGDWWCDSKGTGACSRTLTECQMPRGADDCRTVDVAYCGGVYGMNCYAQLERCTTVTRDMALSKDRELAQSARMCIGVR